MMKSQNRLSMHKFRFLILSCLTTALLFWPENIYAQNPTWSQPISLTNSPQNSNGDPNIAVDRFGNIHVAYVLNSKIYYLKRIAGVWSSPLELTTGNGFPINANYTTPRLAIGIDNIPHLLVSGSPRGPGVSGIYHTSLKVGTWQTAVRISRPTQSAYMLRQPLFVDNNGNVHAIWKENLGWAGDQIFYAKRAEGTWSNAVQATGNEDQTMQAAIVVENDTVRLLTATYPTKLIRERKLAGDAWQNPTILFANTPIDNDSFTAALGINGGLGIGWVKAVGGTKTLEVSTWTGSTWTNPTAILSDTGSRSPVEPMLTIDDYRQAHVVFWASKWQEVNKDQILYATQEASGWSPVNVLSSGTGADGPRIFALDKAYAVWRQQVGSKYDIYFASTDDLTTRTPVVLVPGIAASWNWGVLSDVNPADPNWQWAPTADKGWGGLIKALEAAGYVKDKDYTIAFYDWRKTNDWLDNDPEAAQPAKKYLKAAIDKLLAANPQSTKVNVVGHSLGGLVVRSYVESGEYRGDIDQAILVGTPNQGAAFAYYMWEGAEVPPNWDVVSRTAAKIYMLYLRSIKNSSDLNVIKAYTKSIRNLLSVNANYLNLNNNSIPWNSLQEINTFLGTTSSTDTAVSRFAAKNVRLSTIYGTGTQTVYQINVDPYQNSFGSLWKDGKPNGDLTLLTGDGTVNASSAKINGIENIAIQSKHSRLPSDAAETILRKLGRPYVPQTIAMPSSILTVWTHPVADVEVYDPDDGNPVGLKLAEKPQGGFKIVTVAEPKKPKYKLKVKGQGSGKYTIGTDLQTEVKADSTQKDGTAKNDVTVSYTLALVTESATPIMLTPDDTQAPTTTFSQAGSTITLVGEDDTSGTGVAATDYSLDGVTWLSYSSPFPITTTGTTTLLYRSTDLVGNKEATQSTAIIIVPSPTPQPTSSTTIAASTTQILGTQTDKAVDVVQKISQQAGSIIRSFSNKLLPGTDSSQAIQTTEPNESPQVRGEQVEQATTFPTKTVLIAIAAVALVGSAIGISIASGNGFLRRFKL